MLKKAHSEALESDRPLSIIMADIDFFKKSTINSAIPPVIGRSGKWHKQCAIRYAIDTVIRWGR